MVQAIGWALLHFVWQGALIGAVAAVGPAALRRSAADVRYVVAAIALSLMATMPMVTGVQAWRAAQRREPSHRAVSTEPWRPAARRAAPELAAIGSIAAAGITLVPQAADVALRGSNAGCRCSSSGGWLGVGVLALRLAGGWIWMQRMRSHGAVPADAALQAIVSRLTRRLHISRACRCCDRPASTCRR